MKNHALLLFLLFSTLAFGQSASDSRRIYSIERNHTTPEVVEQCGIALDAPNLKSASDQVIGFACTGSYKNGEKAIMDRDFQYDPNFDPRGGDNVSFEIEETGIDKKLSAASDTIFRINPGKSSPILDPGASYTESDCGDTVVKTIISPIKGINWHGWIAEETSSKAGEHCKPSKEYTEKYRCIHMLIGNGKLSAQLNGVCLLRNREYCLENGLSYDLFREMINTIRFTED